MLYHTSHAVRSAITATTAELHVLSRVTGARPMRIQSKSTKHIFFRNDVFWCTLK